MAAWLRGIGQGTALRGRGIEPQPHTLSQRLLAPVSGAQLQGIGLAVEEGGALLFELSERCRGRVEHIRALLAHQGVVEAALELLILLGGSLGGAALTREREGGFAKAATREGLAKAAGL